MGLSGAASYVIPPRWSEHHQPTATSTMTSQCVITRATGAGTTDASGTWTPSAPRETIYTGACRVAPYNPVGGEKRIVTGEAQVTQRGYRVEISHDADQVLIGDLIEIIDAVDPTFAGVILRVADVKYGSEIWQRDILANETETGS